MPPHYAIVGSGIAGLSAAETLRARQPGAAVTIISEEAHNFYSRPGLAYLLRGDVPERQLFIRTRDDLRALNVPRVNARVEELNCDRREVVLTGGKRVPYDRLLLTPFPLAVPPPFARGAVARLCKLD